MRVSCAAAGASAPASEVSARAAGGGLRRPAHHGHLQRQRHAEMQRRVDQAGAAPAGELDQPRAQRPAHRAGEAAEQREVGDRPARRVAVHPAERGEHRVVQAGAHAETEHRPGGEIDRQRRREPDAGEPERIAQRARRQHRPPAAPIDHPADLRRDQPGDQQPERGAAHHEAERPAGVGDDRLGEHRRKIERGAPGEHLRDAERRDDDAAVRLADRSLRIEIGRHHAPPTAPVQCMRREFDARWVIHSRCSMVWLPWRRSGPTGLSAARYYVHVRRSQPPAPGRSEPV